MWKGKRETMTEEQDMREEHKYEMRKDNSRHKTEQNKKAKKRINNAV